jgi:hypothetical protein
LETFWRASNRGLSRFGLRPNHEMDAWFADLDHSLEELGQDTRRAILAAVVP